MQGRNQFGPWWAGWLAVVVMLTVCVPTRPARAEGVVRVVATEAAEAHSPSISADGRWVVFQGLSGDRHSVFRTDRTSGTTTELATVPAGVHTGDTIGARLSADGCVVVAVTQIAFDLFRDNDSDGRWDVYRLVVPECGGQPNGWELVSADERTGTATDGVFTDSPPAVSGSGAVVAYVHQAPGAPDDVGIISLVDITVPLDEPGRVVNVAGTPLEAPNRAYLYHGQRQPVITENGRHVAFVSDATASDALPGWADGPERGGDATAQVYVWDRFRSDQRTAVTLVSAREDQRSVAGGEAPAISEDGRIVVFTSSDRTLVPAAMPRCAPVCPSQVYRYDRDTDGNGIFDEPARTNPLTIVSAIDAGVVDTGIPIAGDQSSRAPAISDDGSQVAFVTDATNLLPSKRGGGGDVFDGDLLVAEHHLGQIRRVLDDADLISLPGAHGSPSLSKTGQVIAFDTMAAGPLAGAQRVSSGGGRSIVTVEVTPNLSLAALDFGTVVLGFESTELYATVLNAGPASYEPTDIRVGANFKITGGTCARGVIVAAGTSCSVKLTFTPTQPHGYLTDLTVTGFGANAPSVSASVRGAAGEPVLAAEPGGVDLGTSVIGRPGGRVALDIGNIGFLPTSITGIDIGGADPDDFSVVEQSCRNRALNPGAKCTIEIEFAPHLSGYRSALVLVTAATGAYTSSVLGGYAEYRPEFATSIDTRSTPVLPGGELGVGGSGFPADATVAIGFDDGSAPFTSVLTSPDGSFLAVLDLPARLRAGERRLVASAGQQAVVNVEVVIAARPSSEPNRVPGFGLG
ncbi:MAG: choice-of-anchor D domain-containing protein [Ilumatobacteraceae bacterium]